MICDKIEVLKIIYQDQAEIHDNGTVVMHLILVCAKLYKSELMQAQVKADVNDMNIMYENSIRCMNAAWRIKSDCKGVTQVGERKVVLTDMAFKGKCRLCGKYWHKQNKYPEKNKTEEGKGNKNLWYMPPVK